MRIGAACLFLAIMLSGGASPALGEENRPLGSSLHYLALADRWSTQAGDSVIINSLGSVRFVDRHGALLDTAHVVIESWLPAWNHGSQLVSVVVLSFSTADTTWTFPGFFGAGEGDRASLSLMAVPSPLKWRLWHWFGLDQMEELRLDGTQP